MASSSRSTSAAQLHQKTLLSASHDLAKRVPNDEFLVEDVCSSLTYRQFYLLASQLVPFQLQRLCPSLSSPKRRKVVLITANNSLFPLTLWALWFMKFTVVPVSVKSEPSLWTAMVNHADPDALIISSNLKDIAMQHIHLTTDLDVAYLEDIIPARFSLQASSARVSDFIPSLQKWLANTVDADQASDLGLGDVPQIDSNLPVISLFTSSAIDASTVKSVTYTHAMLIHSGTRVIEMLGGPSYSARPVRHLGWLPLSHCFEFCISFIGIVLHTGGSYIFFDRQVSSAQVPLSTPLHIQLLQAIKYHQPVDSHCVVPAIFGDMVRDIDAGGLANLRAMRSIGVGGAPTPEEIFQWAAKQGIPFFDCSGATEVTGTICIRRAMVESMRDHGLQVAPGFEGFLEKESLSDDFGELVLRGAFLPECYDNKASNSFQREPDTGLIVYRTGDLYSQHSAMRQDQLSSSYLKGDGLPKVDSNRQQLSGLKYIGRTDDLVILASGVKIDALAVERRLNEHPHILRSAVISDTARDSPVVLLQSSAEAKTEDIVRFVLEMNRSLSFEKRIRPENVIFVDELPTTTKFTLNRKKVRKIWIESGGKWPSTKSKVSLPAPVNNAPDQRVEIRKLHDHRLFRGEIRTKIERLLSDIFDIPVDHFERRSVHFSDIPLTSISSVRLARSLESQFSIKLSASQLYSFTSVDDICELIVESGHTAQDGSTLHDDPSSTSDTTRVSESSESVDSALVITGASCRYPGKVNSLSDLWEALLDPQSYASRVRKTVSERRWSKKSVEGEDIPPIAWLEDETFDDLESFRDFFQLSPADAESMSPNARLVLQLGYQAIEDAGVAPSSLNGKSWGVFSSVNNSGWRERRFADLELHDYSVSLLGSSDDAAGARLSYFLNLTGPALEIKTACSSSAVAIHQACNAIRNGDCEAAIVIASTTHFHPSGPIFRSNAGIASKSGRCAAFSEDADGFLPGEGVAAIVIQKAVDVQCSPYACIKASHVTQDGRSHGFFAPNPAAQTRLLNQVLEKACYGTDDIDFIETHGTGTQLGDAVELQALDKVFRGKRARPLFIGAAKAVLGHTEETAGLTSVLKSLLCLQNNAIPGQPNFRRPNPQIDFGGSKFSIPRRIVSFPRVDRPRRIGVSSFGLSGTLAHIILEDFDDSSRRSSLSNASPKVFVLSANNGEAYECLLRRYINFAMSPEALEADVGSVCMTSQLARDHLPVRRAWHIQDHYSWTTVLSNELRNPTPQKVLRQGNIKIGMWFGLPMPETAFHLLEHPLIGYERQLVQSGNWDERYAVFAQQVTLSNALKALGCQIAAVGGEGMAEWAAGVCAGILRPDSVFQKRADRERNELETYLVRGSKEKITDLLTQWLPSELSLRGRHTDDLYILEGSPEAVREFSKLGGFIGDSVSHNAALTRAEPPPTSSVASVSAEALTFVSGRLGEALDEETLASPIYWARATHDFFDTQRGIHCLSSQCDLVLHIGGPSLEMILNTEKYVHFGTESFESLLGLLYERGCDIDWTKFGMNGRRLHVPLSQWSTKV